MNMKPIRPKHNPRTMGVPHRRPRASPPAIPLSKGAATKKEPVGARKKTSMIGIPKASAPSHERFMADVYIAVTEIASGSQVPHVGIVYKAEEPITL
jgi:hypothetical protein